MSARVIHVFNSCIVSGPETLVLPALGAMPWPTCVVFLTESRREEESQRPIRYARSLGLTTRAISVRSRVDRAAIQEFAGLLAELKPEIVHAHDVKASTYLLKAAQLIPNRKFKLFSTHHGVRGRSGFRAKLYERYYCHLILPRYDRVLAVCTSDRDRLLARRLSKHRVRLHLNGVDRPRVTAESRDARSRELRQAWGVEPLRLEAEAPLLGFVGRIAPEKRLDRILRVLKQLRIQRPDLGWNFAIFGTGPLEAPLRAVTRALELDDRVHWMGYRAGVGSEMAGFDLLLSMSDAEGLPINLIEAGWAATPVLATAVDGNLDLIPSGQFGALFPHSETDEAVANRLGKLLDNPTHLRELGLRFQERVAREFSGRQWLDQLIQLYKEVLSNP